jgi:eukaryotic-like serine/threonine-protein kinase
MTPDRWHVIERIFESMADRPTAEMADILDPLDPELRDEIEKLLAADGRAATLIRGAVAGGQSLLQDLLPQRFGPYRVTETIGRGGMGAVYRALRDDQTFEMQVAIKVLHLGMETSAGLQRFRQERQILAGLEHPNIARLIDGGETASGVPYIVIEYVEGQPITHHCASRNLSRTLRLRLFLRVCEAVEYAHRHLIVHRDLKPANILVTAEGQPKLLDFGIAKLLDANTSRTQTGLIALTPDYASPEQVRGLPVSTASDVYSLGVILYELLTDRRPYEIPSLSPADIDRAVCQATPARAGVSDDLDNILMMALRKEPERRYASVRELAEDIERSLTSRPVRARPDTLIYRTGKFARRHRTPLAAAAMIAAALIGGVVASQRQARRAERRFAESRQVLNSFLFDVNRRLQDATGPTAAREQVVGTALPYLEKLAAEAEGDPSLQADLTSAYQKVGDIQYLALGRVDDARRSYTRAIELGERLLAGRKPPPAVRKSLAEAYLGVVGIDTRRNDQQRAMTYGERALSLAEGAEPGNGWSRDFLIDASNYAARPYLEMGRPMQALTILRKGLGLAEEGGVGGTSDEELYARGRLRQHIIVALKNHGDLPAAMAEAEHVRALYLSMSDPANSRWAPVVIFGLISPGNDWGTGPPDVSLATPAAVRQGFDIALQALARDPRNSVIRNAAGIAYRLMGEMTLHRDRRAADRLFRQAVRMLKEIADADPGNALMRSRVAGAESALAATVDARESLVHLRRALDVAETVPASFPMERRTLIESLLRLGEAETGARQFDQARVHLERALQFSLATWREAREDLRSFAYLGMNYEAIGTLERLSGHPDAACQAYRRSLDAWQTWPTAGVSSSYDREHAAQVVTKLSKCP